MLGHRRVTPSIKFAGTHLYTWVERRTVRVNGLAQEHNVPGLVLKRLPKRKFLRMWLDCIRDRQLKYTREQLHSGRGIVRSLLHNY